MIGSMSELAQGEIYHMETIAKMFLNENVETPDYDKVIIRDTPFTGGKRSHTIESWPAPEFLEGKRKSKMSKFQLVRLDWGMGDKYIESIKFTMSDSYANNVSPKYGRKAITNFCDFEDKITKVTMMSKSGRLVGLVFDTERYNEFLKIMPSSELPSGTVVEEIDYDEFIVGFKARMH